MQNKCFFINYIICSKRIILHLNVTYIFFLFSFFMRNHFFADFIRIYWIPCICARRRLRCKIFKMIHVYIFVHDQSYYGHVVLRKCSRIIYDYVNHIFRDKISKSIITRNLCYLMRDSRNRIRMTGHHVYDYEC